MSGYVVNILNPSGTLVYSLNNFPRLEFSRQENAVGALNLSVFPDFPTALLSPDYRIQVYRYPAGYSSYLEGGTEWIIRRYKRVTTDAGERIIEINAYDAVSLLDRRIIPYNNASSTSSYTMTADDMMKTIVSANFVSDPLNTSRNMSIMSVDGLASKGLLFTKTFQNRKVLECIKEIADTCRGGFPESAIAGIYMGFDVIKSGTGFMFTTYPNQRGVNRGLSGLTSDRFTASKNSGNLSSPEIIYDYTNEANVIYCGGTGTGSAKLYTVAYDNNRVNLTPYARCEAYFDSKNSEDVNALQTEADYYLRYTRPKIQFNGKILETDKALWGVHFWFGDIISVEYDGLVLDCHLDTYKILWENGKETLDLYARSEAFV